MVTVGELAALINIAVLLVVAVADRAVELIVRAFAIARLSRTRRAPVVHDSDTWLPNIPRSLYKYHRYPAILLTLVFSVLLIASELISELGVGSRKKCAPQLKSATVITDRATNLENVTDAEQAASSIFLQSITFLDGDLDFVAEGFPHKLSESFCLRCLRDNLRNNPHLYLMANCTVNDAQTYQAGELDLRVVTTGGAFGTITLSFREIDEADQVKREYTGAGDLTRNGNHLSTFLFSSVPKPDRQNETHYLEYSHGEHIKRLISWASHNGLENQKTEFWNKTTGLAYRQVITCGTNRMEANSFEKALRVYRSMQLENTITPKGYLAPAQRFENLTIDDVYRSVLSVKLIDHATKNGTYCDYTECGRYDVRIMLPFFACLGSIAALGLASYCVRPRNLSVEVPHNSTSWYREARQARDQLVKTGGGGVRRRYLNYVRDEMVLVGEGGSEEVHVKWRDEQLQQQAVFRDLGAGPASSIDHDDSAVEMMYSPLERGLASTPVRPEPVAQFQVTVQPAASSNWYVPRQAGGRGDVMTGRRVSSERREYGQFGDT